MGMKFMNILATSAALAATDPKTLYTKLRPVPEEKSFLPTQTPKKEGFPLSNDSGYVYGCYDGYCFSYCGYLHMNEWCYLSKDNDYTNYVTCKKDSDCTSSAANDCVRTMCL